MTRMLFRGTSDPFGRVFDLSVDTQTVLIELENTTDENIIFPFQINAGNNITECSSSLLASAIHAYEANQTIDAIDVTFGKTSFLTIKSGSRTSISINLSNRSEVCDLRIFCSSPIDVQSLGLNLRFLGKHEPITPQWDHQAQVFDAFFTYMHPYVTETALSDISDMLAKIDAILAIAISEQRSDIFERFLAYFSSIDTNVLFDGLLSENIFGDRDACIFLIAATSTIALRKTGWLSTASLASFSHWLNSENSINVFLEYINEFAIHTDKSGIQYVISKHSLNPSWLKLRQPALIEAIGEICDFFSERGSECVVCYGTLLGAVRNKSFIPHDDDVDLLYFDGSSSEENALERWEDIIVALEARGFKTSVTHGLKHINLQKGLATCDLFTCWMADEKLYLPMENYKMRPIDASIVFPHKNKTVELYGKKFLAPAMPEEFLRERYGENWKTPDKFHEWPWSLSKS